MTPQRPQKEQQPSPEAVSFASFPFFVATVYQHVEGVEAASPIFF
jgi:hypothetical protein